MKKKSRFLQTPIEPLAVESGLIADALLGRMERIALANSALPLLAKRTKPAFNLASRPMTIDGQTVPNDRFEEMNESAV